MVIQRNGIRSIYKSSVFYSISFLAIASLFITLIVFPYSYDDAYITYRYAYNFATGSGLVYQPGETSLSTTAPVYALFLGILALPFPEKIPLIAGWMSGIGLFAGALGMFIIAHRKGQDLVGFLAGLANIFFPLLMEMFGGEVIPLTALIVWGFIAFDSGKSLLAGLLLGIAVGFRLDAWIPIGVLFIYSLLKELRIPWRFALGVGIPTGIWTSYSILRYDSVFPITLTAKLAQSQSGMRMPFAQGAIELIHSFLGSKIISGSAALPIYRIYLFLVFVGLIALFIRSRYWLLFLASELFIVLGYSFLGAPFYHWYFIPILVISAILIGIGLGVLPALFLPIIKKMPKIPRILSYGITGMVIIGLILPPVVNGAMMALNNELSVQKDYPSKPYREIGEWLADHTPDDSTVGHIEIGIIGYYSLREMIDPAGLVTPAAIQHVREDDLAWAYRKYLPNYLIVNPRFNGILGPYQYEPWFENCYKVVHSVEDLQIYQRCEALNKNDLIELEKTQVSNDQAAGEILPGRSIGQTFVAKQNHLRSVGVLLATYGRETEGMLIFHLQEVTQEYRSLDLATVELDISEVADNSWRIFSFPPIEDSKDRIYYFYLEAPQIQSGEAITAWATSTDTYPNGSLFIEHRPQPGDLSFMLYYVQP